MVKSTEGGFEARFARTSTTEAEFPAEEYVGAAEVSTGSVSTDSVSTGSTTGGTVEVRVTLRGHFEPLDGRFHWYGRISAETATGLAPGATVRLTTPHGSAEGRLSDLDPWGRLRISGTGRPPF
jgi:hypothetical protein